jgi:probable HAF family extracellular repeat protein
MMKPQASLSLAVGVVLTACHSVTEAPRATSLLAKFATAPTVMMTDLGTLGPEPGVCPLRLSESIDVNERGLVVGWSDSACAGPRGFIWDNGTMTTLGTVLPVAVNNHDQIVGLVGDVATGGGIFPFGPTRGFLLEDGAMTDLGTLGGDRTVVSAVNDHGQIVGSSATATSAIHAFLWHVGAMTDLGTLGGDWSEAIAVNDHGQVVGNSHSATGTTHAFVWRDGTMRDLGTLGGARSVARAMNDRGQIVGASATATGETHAFLWQDGVMTDLGTLGEGSSDAHAVNNHGQVAGLAGSDTRVPRVFLWQDGTMTELANPQPSNHGFSGLLRMNDRAQIVGAIRFAVPLRGGTCFLWQDGAIVDLGGVGNTVALNKHGQIVGWVYTFSDPFRHATLWTVGRPDHQPVQMAAGAGEGP